MGARLEQSDPLAGDLKTRFVEHVVAEAAVENLDAALLERAEMAEKIRQHECEQRRLRKLTAVQPDREPPVGNDGVRIRPGLTDRDLAESETLVERDRGDQVRRMYADFVEAANHRGGSGAARVRSVTRRARHSI